jgi:dCTP diphosphatase
MNALRERLHAFVAARDWQRFHSPKNLSMALVVEAAELVEHFQWLSEEQSRQLDAETLAEVEQELADIFVYLVRIADQLEIDLYRAAEKKIVINERKYPVEKARGRAVKYTKL